MPNLKDLKKRIDSVKSTRKITSAMKMVAASKLRRAQEQAEAARPFAERMERVVASMAAGLPQTGDLPRMLSGTGKDDAMLIVVVTSERGQCGPLNSNLVRTARRRIAALTAEGKDVKILCVGKKGRDMLRRNHGQRIVGSVDMAGVRWLSFADVQPIAEKIAEMFDRGECDRCLLLHNTFVTVMTQTVTEQQVIPVPIDDSAPTELEGGAAYEAEPDEAQILADLLPRNLAVQVYRALLENVASEQGARMAAMDSATRNAAQMIDRLTLGYNRARQAAITTELTEIISGAEAL